MSKIYEALEHARTERMASAEPLGPSAFSMPVCMGGADLDMEQEMISLYQTIRASLPMVDHPSLLLIGSRSNEGTSTIAQQLAKTASMRMEKAVLLIDLDRSRPDLHVYVKTRPEKPAGTLRTGHPMEDCLRRVQGSNLYVLPLFERTMTTPGNLDTLKGHAFWEPLKERFDLIIVDSPPATMFPDGPGIVSDVDGVILVVEAEKVRWQVVLSVKDKIVKNGGNILGIVFNKRHYYIPQRIYRNL